MMFHNSTIRTPSCTMIQKYFIDQQFQIKLLEIK